MGNHGRSLGLHDAPLSLHPPSSTSRTHSEALGHSPPETQTNQATDRDRNQRTPSKVTTANQRSKPVIPGLARPRAPAGGQPTTVTQTNSEAVLVQSRQSAPDL